MSGTFTFRNQNVLAFESREREVLLSGAAGTGKSLTFAVKMLALLGKYDRCRGLFCRGTRASLTQSGLVTWERVLDAAGMSDIARTATRRVRQSYEFPNGSELVVAGLDDPGKTLSSEYDFCFVADTRVFSPSPIERGFDRPYSGQLVTIATAAGNKLTGTPNHPILTPQGWVGLGQLRKGGYVISRVGSQPLPTHADPDVAQQPAPIAEVVRALSQRRGGRGLTERVETVPMHFHGDGTHGYVDVVTPFGQLKRRRGTEVDKPLVEAGGGRAELANPLLVSYRPPFEPRLTRRPLFRSAATAPELPHSLAVRLGFAPRLRKPLGMLGHLLAPLRVPAQLLEPVGIRLGGCLPLDATGGHLTLESGHADVDGRRDTQQPPFACEVAADSVIDVAFTDAGRGRHVYNLQTADSWYFANNILAHNCYIQESTEEGVTLEVYETLLRALRNGKMVKDGAPWHQIFMDCNPTTPTHWLFQRQANGGPLKMYTSTHKDNPAYWDDATGDYTPEGRDYIEGTLASMSGARRDRFYLGLWKAAEGLVYDGYDPKVHDLAPGHVPPRDWPRVWGIDWGFVNPTAMLIAAIDPDGRAIVYKEFYRTHTRAEELARWATEEVSSGREPLPVAVVCDHDPECAATFQLYGPAGIAVTMADKGDKLGGIEATQERFDVLKPPYGDGKPRLLLVPDMLAHRPDETLKATGKPTGFMTEVLGYCWDTRNPNRIKDEPLDANNHSADCLRYMIRWIDKYTQKPAKPRKPRPQADPFARLPGYTFR